MKSFPRSRLVGLVSVLVLVALSAIVQAAPKAGAKFQISCEVELTNGAGTKTLRAESKLFGEDASGDSVSLPFGPYNLVSEIERIVESRTEGVPVSPPANPSLQVKIIELPKTKPGEKQEPRYGLPPTIFLANVGGIRFDEIKRPLVLSGYQFREFEHEKTKYTRIDYECRLAKAR